MMPNEIDTAIKNHGHDVIKVNNRYRCFRCNQSWHCTKRGDFSRAGKCPGPGIWGLLPEDLDIPRRLVKGYTIYWAGSIVCDTHRLGYLRGLLFCWACGAYSADRVVGLSAKCKMKPTASGAAALKSIKQGRHPDSRRQLAPSGCYPPPPPWLNG